MLRPDACIGGCWPHYRQPSGQNARMHPTLRRLGLVWLCLALGGPAAAASPSTALPTTTSAVLPARSAHWRAGPGQTLLLGETHDNAAQHALRVQVLAALLDAGDRPALLMEQFDRERQAAIDRALRPSDAAGPAALDAWVEAVIDAGGRLPGWNWDYYRPFIRLALQHGLPIVAANVPRAEARRIIELGLAATGWQATVPDDIARAHAAAIEAGHCGQIDAAMAARLADAQVARDQFMARMIGAQAARGAVLLAGNGHVRKDIGVPRWLPPALREHSQAVGFLEPGEPDADVYDDVVVTAAQPRADPCATMRPVVPVAPSAPASR